MPTVRCANCGAENRDTSRFCTACGGELAAAATVAAPSPEPVALPPAPAQPQGAGNPPPPAARWQAPGAPGAPPPAMGWQAPSSPQQFGEVIRGMVAPLEPLGKQIPTWVGALFVLIGVFLPAAVSPLGSVALWDFAKGTMLTLLGVAVVAAALAATRRYAGLRTAGIIAFFLVGTDFFDLLTSGASNPSWAFLLLWPGTFLIILASLIPDSGRSFSFSSISQYNPPPGAAR